MSVFLITIIHLIKGLILFPAIEFSVCVHLSQIVES